MSIMPTENSPAVNCRHLIPDRSYLTVDELVDAMILREEVFRQFTESEHYVLGEEDYFIFFKDEEKSSRTPMAIHHFSEAPSPERLNELNRGRIERQTKMAHVLALRSTYLEQLTDDVQNAINQNTPPLNVEVEQIGGKKVYRVMKRSAVRWADAVYGQEMAEFLAATILSNGTWETSPAGSAGEPRSDEDKLFLAICWFMDFVLTKVIADWKSMAADPTCDVTRSFMANGKPNPTGIFRLIEDKYNSEPSGDRLTTTKKHIRSAVEYILNQWPREVPFLTTRQIPYAHRTLYGLLMTAHEKCGIEDPLPDPTTDLPGFIEAAHEILLPSELLSFDELASCLESCIRRRTNMWREPS